MLRNASSNITGKVPLQKHIKDACCMNHRIASPCFCGYSILHMPAHAQQKKMKCRTKLLIPSQNIVRSQTKASADSVACRLFFCEKGDERLRGLAGDVIIRYGNFSALVG